jgi:hypothetical protein
MCFRGTVFVLLHPQIAADGHIYSRTESIGHAAEHRTFLDVYFVHSLISQSVAYTRAKAHPGAHGRLHSLGTNVGWRLNRS